MNNNLTIEEAVHIARQLYRMGKDISPLMKLYDVSEEMLDEIMRRIIPSKATIISSAGTGPNVDVTWVNRVQEHDWQYWSAQEHYLRFVKNWPSDIVDSIAEESETILRRIPDPLSTGPFTGKGLVIGFVQSGKTANYTALAARAVDAGYRLIIVLSGIHNALRTQTQTRLDRELVGYLREGEIGVEKPPHGRQWVRLTDNDQDFSLGVASELLQGNQPILAVIKKTCPVLQRLHQWLKLADKTTLASCPTLIIDDEADQASINTGRDRIPGEVDEECIEDTEYSPSETNKLIRLIVHKDLPKLAYVAYTATPFANVLIDPESEDLEAGGDLFPDDFVHQLPRPIGYTGTKELFGDNNNDGRDVLRHLDDSDLQQLRPPSMREQRNRWHPRMSSSLIRAINEFIIAGAVRIARGYGHHPNTMLVHTTHYTDAHRKIVDVIRDHVDGIRGELNYNIKRYLNELHELWHTSYSTSLDDKHCFDDLIPAIVEMIQSVRVLELNSVSADELDYESNPPLRVIAVGGNRLSRGLTLEGLTVSVFLRTTNMCDTLLQMARWYGYRFGYEDLIRIYTTSDIAEWFSELAIVEDDMRDEVDRLRSSDLTPREQGVQLRAHPALLLTSRAKSQHATIIHEVSYSGAHIQTILLPVRNRKAMDLNFDLTSNLVDDFDFVQIQGGLYVTDIPVSRIVNFIRNMYFSPDVRAFDKIRLIQWIMKQNENELLSSWTIFIPKNESSDANSVIIGPHELSMVRRSRLRNQESIGVLVDPKHEAIDLSGGASSYRNANGNYDTRRMREARAETNGLLLIYVIDPASEARSPGRERLVPYDASDPEAVIGIALSLPYIKNETVRDIVVGRKWAND